MFSCKLNLVFKIARWCIRELLFLRKQLVCSKTRMATLETHQAEVLPELPATLEKYIENERNKLH